MGAGGSLVKCSIAHFGGVTPPRTTVRANSPMIGGMSASRTDEVTGFTAPAEVQVVDGLPLDTNVPADTLDLLADAHTVADWLEAGGRVRAWCDAHGLDDTSWMAPDGTVTMPEEVLEESPDAVRQWVLDAPEATAALRRLRRVD